MSGFGVPPPQQEISRKKKGGMEGHLTTGFRVSGVARGGLKSGCSLVLHLTLAKNPEITAKSHMMQHMAYGTFFFLGQLTGSGFGKL